ncbi:hypothetical protein [Pseudomonas putida]|uniref:hypothetical protein n=1 Tax=Pseudomonas putida TaxID=303 RepID=UPI003D96377B
MTDDNKQPRTAADRQREYKERQRAAGYKLTAIWVHEASEAEGRQAAIEGKPLKPAKATDPLSWAMGWINAKK